MKQNVSKIENNAPILQTNARFCGISAKSAPKTSKNAIFAEIKKAREHAPAIIAEECPLLICQDVQQKYCCSKIIIPQRRGKCKPLLCVLCDRYRASGADGRACDRERQTKRQTVHAPQTAAQSRLTAAQALEFSFYRQTSQDKAGQPTAHGRHIKRQTIPPKTGTLTGGKTGII